MTDENTPIVVLHIDESGESSFLASGDVRFFVIDDTAPHDRVYEILDRVGRDEILAMIGDDIGNQNDERHAAIEAVIAEAFDGKPRLRLVTGDAYD